MNPIVQFVGYFRGPILFGARLGMCIRSTTITEPLVDSDGTSCPSGRWSQRLDRLWCHCASTNHLRVPRLPSLIRNDKIGILMLNAFVGWYQEKQAGDIVEQLKAGIAMKATVRPHALSTSVDHSFMRPAAVHIGCPGRTGTGNCGTGGRSG
jgi:hypothetical protein